MAYFSGVKFISGNSKKTGKPFDGAVVYFLDSDSVDVIGALAGEQYIDRVVFDKALAGRKVETLLNASCSFVYDKGGFLKSFSIDSK